MVNQCGGALFGKSKVIAPDGTITLQASRVGRGDATELVIARVDLLEGIRAAERTAGALWAGQSSAAR
jgi:hypothetical protein